MDPNKQKESAPLDDFRILQPEEDEIMEELNELEGFREAQRHRENEDNFGDFS